MPLPLQISSACPRIGRRIHHSRWYCPGPSGAPEAPGLVDGPGGGLSWSSLLSSDFFWPQPLTSLWRCNCSGLALSSTTRDVTLGQVTKIRDQTVGLVGLAKLTFNASFLEKLLSQQSQGNGLTERWILL